MSVSKFEKCWLVEHHTGLYDSYRRKLISIHFVQKDADDLAEKLNLQYSKIRGKVHGKIIRQDHYTSSLSHHLSFTVANSAFGDLPENDDDKVKTESFESMNKRWVEQANKDMEKLSVKG